MYQTGCNAYRQSAGNSVEDNRMVLIKLFDGAVKFIFAAKRGIEIKSAKIRGENISKTIAIITELNCALDMEKGGSLAENLASLYQFALEQLTIGNIKNDPDALDRVMGILKTLKEGFEEAIRQQKMAAGMSIIPAPEMETPCRAERVSYAV